MRLLLATHAFLWFVLGDMQLSATALTQILEPAQVKLVSPALSHPGSETVAVADVRWLD